ncbi:FeoA family protein [Nitratiruptor sp. YY09-18]|uniref:FeoA family protein n=1 Tax=Nitratiruptor sp. YY09-18 TaxID=2724901 RepID=UPI0019166FB4|nr:FeoA family protein [Nitratiruptor sp. YY09-18]BCD67986.1 ferrous iron transport protein A [Nitratiruptor sp. YY09-18]
MKLSEAQPGKEYKIIAIEGECDEYKCKLEAMGLRRGDIVKVLQKGFFGPIQVEVNGARIGLCRGQTKKIEVKEVKENR